jgi:hypothetical protein
LFGFFWVLNQSDAETRRSLFLTLIPFFLVGVLLWASIIFATFGKVEVRVDGDLGTVFNGVGRVGWRRSFDWGQIQKIRIFKIYITNFPTKLGISLEGDQVVNFAKGMKTERLHFMLIALRVMHRQRQSG